MSLSDFVSQHGLVVLGEAVGNSVPQARECARVSFSHFSGSGGGRKFEMILGAGT